MVDRSCFIWAACRVLPSYVVKLSILKGTAGVPVLIVKLSDPPMTLTPQIGDLALEPELIGPHAQN